MANDRTVKIDVTETDDAHVIIISGDVDLSCSEDVRRALADCAGRRPTTVVDMSGVTVIDSSGIASLLEGHQLAKKRGARMVLAACGISVTRVLGLAKLDNVFELADSVEAAAAGVDR